LNGCTPTRFSGLGTNTVKAYLDNNIVSAIARDDHPAESQALDQLLKAKDEGKGELVTSEVTLQEISRYVGVARPLVERIFRLLEKVPIERWDRLVGIHSYGNSRTWINTPLIQNDPDYAGVFSPRHSPSCSGS
jgi:hypothetical protein